MRATFTKLIYILPIVLAFISVNLMGQTKAQLDEIKSYEQKIEMNKDNPHFDVETAKIQLEGLKKQYGVVTEKSDKVTESSATPFATATSVNKSAGKTIEAETTAGADRTSAKKLGMYRSVYNILPAEGKSIITDNASSFIILEDGSTLTDKNIRVITQQEVTKFLALPLERRTFYLNKLDQL